MSAPDLPDLMQRLRALEAECAELRTENRRLRGTPNVPPEILLTARPDIASSVHQRSAEPEKIALFRTHFRGREDVYAVRWMGKTGSQDTRRPRSLTGHSVMRRASRRARCSR